MMDHFPKDKLYIQVDEQGLLPLFPITLNLFVTSELTRALNWVDQIARLKASLYKYLTNSVFLQFHYINMI